MNVRTLTLGTAAIAAALLCALPASAQPRYTQHSTAEERAQTDALNSEAMERARGNSRDMAHYDRGYHGGSNSGGTISINFGDIAFGYSDGYWDNGHRWHTWRNDGEAREYRNRHGSNYHGWRHNRDHDNGWTRR